jgi:hypothetical protein
MADSPEPIVDEDDAKAHERDKLDIGDSRPADPDIRQKPKRQADELDVGDPHPEKPDTDAHT